MHRRNFLRRSLTGSILIGSGKFPLGAFHSPELSRLTILHTNDVHSRIDPFPMDGSPNQGLGGAVKRAALIQKIRSEQEQVLLLDSGDIFQGTPYFNFFCGELEFKVMSEMRYDASTIGNHDFDAGIDGLNKQLPHATFDFICANYNFRNTVLNEKVAPYKIYQRGPLRIGIFGLGIELKGLVPESLYGDTQYLDPITIANRTSQTLLDQDVHMVVCLSHLGYRYSSNKIDDIKLAKMTSGIDLILGGHTHTFLDEPEVVANKDGDAVIINQVGWAGILLGRVDLLFEHNRQAKCFNCRNIWIS